MLDHVRISVISMPLSEIGGVFNAISTGKVVNFISNK